MKRVSFGSEVAFVPGGDLLVGVTVAPLTPRISEESRIQVANRPEATGNARHDGCMVTAGYLHLQLRPTPSR